MHQDEIHAEEIDPADSLDEHIFPKRERDGDKARDEEDPNNATFPERH